VITPPVRSREVLALLEKAYDLSLEEGAWLQRLADTARPLLDNGFGACAWKVSPKTGQIAGFAASGAPEWVPILIKNLVGAASGAERATASRRRFTTLSQNFGVNRWLNLEIVRQHVLPHGIEDAVSINAMDAEGRFLVVVCAPLRKAASPTTADDSRWNRIAGHVAAASRLRRRLLEETFGADGEAVVATSGAVEHARGKAAPRSAREVLREAVLQREKALGEGTADPETPLRLWRGLVQGQWSLVDRFERDGRRYVVAHPNAVKAPGPRTMSSHERAVIALAAQGQPLKNIAYDLGLSAPTVSHALKSGMAKMGVASRADLTRVFATLHAPSPHRSR
jgi:DNA-binding CsgD family transcriptional regulator